jgi:hypothetical protein
MDTPNSPGLSEASTMEASPSLPALTRQRSATARVNVNHFDPEGVSDLRRRMSEASVLSDVTLDVDEEFGFEKLLRRTVQR